MKASPLIKTFNTPELKYTLVSDFPFQERHFGVTIEIQKEQIIKYMMIIKYVVNFTLLLSFGFMRIQSFTKTKLLMYRQFLIILYMHFVDTVSGNIGRLDWFKPLKWIAQLYFHFLWFSKLTVLSLGAVFSLRGRWTQEDFVHVLRTVSVVITDYAASVSAAVFIFWTDGNQAELILLNLGMCHGDHS